MNLNYKKQEKNMSEMEKGIFKQVHSAYYLVQVRIIRASRRPTESYYIICQAASKLKNILL